MKSPFKKKEIGKMFMRGDERFVIIIDKNIALQFDEMGASYNDPEEIDTLDDRKFISWDYEIFDLEVGSPTYSSIGEVDD